jgi:hypothetical protein
VKALRVTLVLMVLVSVVAWFALRDTSERPAAVVASGAERHDVTETASSDASAVTAVVDERVPTPQPVAQRIVPLAEALAPELVVGTAKLVGSVRPAPGRDALTEKMRVFATDRFGAGHGATLALDGGYRISELSPGPYWLRAWSEEDGEAKARVQVSEGQAEVRQDLQLALPVEIRVKVVDRGGQPIDDFTSLAVATLEPPGDWFDVSVGNFNNQLGVGRFRASARTNLGVAHGGAVVLDVEPPVYVSLLHYQRVIATERVERGRSEVVFVVERDSPLLASGSVSFQLVDAETRAPLAASWASFGAFSLQSNDSWFRRVRMSPGWYEITAQVAGYESLDRRVRVDPGVENDFGAIALAREVWIDGQIVDENGVGCPGDLAVDGIDAATGEMMRGSALQRDRTNGEGGFHVGMLSRATYAVHCCDHDTRFAKSVKLIDTRNGPVENVRIVVALGVPLYVRPSSEQWRGVRFRILDDSKTVVCAQSFSTDAPTPLLLAPGRYDVEVRTSEKSEPTRTTLTIGTEPVELALP